MEANDIKYLMIQRKDSLSFMEFIRGKYDTTNIDYIKKLLTNMTISERNMILNYKFEDNSVQGNIKIALKYHPTNKLNAIRSLVRVSKPGLRKYAGHANLPKVMNGLGIAIISTSKGLMTDKEARNLNIGGEVICYIS